MPETKIDQTQGIIKKLSSVFNNYQELFDDQTIEIKSSICSEEIFAEDTESGYIKIIERMEAKLNESNEPPATD